MAREDQSKNEMQDAYGGADVIRTVTDVDEGVIEDRPQNTDADPALHFIAGEEIEYTLKEEQNTSLNYSSLMGIREDTRLDPSSQQYSWVSSIFYAGYIAWEFHTTYLLRCLPLGKYTSANIILWGLVLTQLRQPLVLRLFFGALEATVTPAFIILTSAWYKNSKQAKRVGFWLSCNGVALLVIGPIAYGLSG
ncbi:hypothetical protein diail_9661, partial [Diaporthe ilicicola]